MNQEPRKATVLCFFFFSFKLRIFGDTLEVNRVHLFLFVLTLFKCLIGETDFNFNFTKSQAVHSYNTRRSNDIRLPLPRTNWGKQTFIFHAAKDWNSLPNDLKECNILSIFKSKLKTFLKDLS